MHVLVNIFLMILTLFLVVECKAECQEFCHERSSYGEGVWERREGVDLQSTEDLRRYAGYSDEHSHMFCAGANEV